MKMLLKSAMLTFLLAMVFNTAQAQKRGDHDKDPAQRAEHQTSKMVEKLGLNADQATKVKAINLKYAEKAKADHDANKAKKMEAREAMRTEHDAELSKVLTKEQADKWKAQKADGKGKDGKGHKGGGRDKDPADRAEHQTAKMTEQLGLNADQAAKVKAINQKYAEKAKADREKNRAAHDAMRTEHDKELSKVLTKDQAAKWEQLKAERQAKKGGQGKQKGKSGKSDLKKG